MQTVLLQRATLAEEVRFELTERCRSAVFKTAGINHSPTLPYYLVRVAGLEPTTSSFQVKHSTRLSYTLLFFLVVMDGLEPSTYPLSGDCSTN